MFSTIRKFFHVYTPQLNRIVAGPAIIGTSARTYHLLAQPSLQTKVNFMNIIPPTLLTAPTNDPQLIQTCGMKIRGKVHRRCRDCYMVVRKERLYNLCTTHPRHKQMSMVRKAHNLRILTHATQSKVRPW